MFTVYDYINETRVTVLVTDNLNEASHAEWKANDEATKYGFSPSAFIEAVCEGRTYRITAEEL